jgi:hypothetical protein
MRNETENANNSRRSRQRIGISVLIESHPRQQSNPQRTYLDTRRNFLIPRSRK